MYSEENKKRLDLVLKWPIAASDLTVGEFFDREFSYISDIRYFFRRIEREELDDDFDRLRDYLSAKHGITSRKADNLTLEKIAEILRTDAGLQIEQPTEWTSADGPTQWARIFGVSASTFMRRIKEKKIRHKQLSTKSYQIAIDDLPAAHQEKFRNKKK